MSCSTRGIEIGSTTFAFQLTTNGSFQSRALVVERFLSFENSHENLTNRNTKEEQIYFRIAIFVCGTWKTVIASNKSSSRIKRQKMQKSSG